MLLNLEPDDFYRRIANRENKLKLEESLRKELKGLEAILHKYTDGMTNLETGNALGDIHPEIYRQAKDKLQKQIDAAEKRAEEVELEIEQISREHEALKTLQQIRAGFKDRLGQLTDDEWRELFISLDMEIHVRTPDIWSTSQTQGKRFSIAAATRTDIEITFGLPLEAEPIKNIVLTRAESNSP
ncbi:hypothetical protein ACFLTQ_00580 [Chloroflexota bacterium]